jgi:hypothetical protein
MLMILIYYLSHLFIQYEYMYMADCTGGLRHTSPRPGGERLP